MTVHAEQVVEEVADSAWLERLARLGFCCRGVVYVVVALLAMQIALHGDAAGGEASKEGALREIAVKPFAGVLLTVLAIGLAGYAAWRLSEAAWGSRDEEDEAKRTGKRLLSAGKAAVYLILLASTVRVLRRGPSGADGGDGEEEALTARIFELPAGRLLAGGIALVIVGAGGYVVYRGLAQKFEKRLDTTDMGPRIGPVVGVIGTIGLVARGLVVSLAGLLLLKATVDFDAQEAVGLDGTLKAIARQSYGQVLLSLAAFGLACYGLYSLCEARYRQL